MFFYHREDALDLIQNRLKNTHSLYLLWTQQTNFLSELMVIFLLQRMCLSIFFFFMLLSIYVSVDSPRTFWTRHNTVFQSLILFSSMDHADLL